MKMLEHAANSYRSIYDLTVTAAPYSYTAGVFGAWLHSLIPGSSVVEMLPWIVGLMVLDALAGARVAARSGRFEFRKLVWKTIDKALGYLLVAAAAVWLAKFAVGKEASHTLVWGVAMAVAATELVSCLKHARALGVAKGIVQPIEDRLKAQSAPKPNEAD